MVTREEAIEKAKEAIQKTDKGNLDTYIVPVAKEDKIISSNLKIDFNPEYWMIRFKRYLHSSRMYFIWEIDSVEEG